MASTYVETNIRVPKGSRKKTVGFHWVEHWDSYEDEDGKPTGMSLTLPGWLYDGIIEGGGVLSIHEDYFLLTGGIERWLYRVARKHAGSQEMGWQFTMAQLYAKSGSAARISDFAIDVRKVVTANSLPEYALALQRDDKGEESVWMVRRSQLALVDPRVAAECPRRATAGRIKARPIGRSHLNGRLPASDITHFRGGRGGAAGLPRCLALDFYYITYSRYFGCYPCGYVN